MDDLFARFSPVDFVAVLPTTSRDYVVSMINSGIDPIAIAAQIADAPADGLAPKGGLQWTKDLLSRVMREMHALLCTEDPKYADVRNQLRGEGATTARVVVYVITSAVASTTDMAHALCVPLVATILAAVAKAGKSAWCQATAPAPSP